MAFPRLFRANATPSGRPVPARQRRNGSVMKPLPMPRRPDQRRQPSCPHRFSSLAGLLDDDPRSGTRPLGRVDPAPRSSRRWPCRSRHAGRPARSRPPAGRHRTSRGCPCASGTSPRNGTPSRSASLRAPPWPKMSDRVPQCGQMKVDMFSTMPSTGTSTLRNMAMPRRASISARSCGVETITAPASGTAWAIVSCASPVPGGMSTTSTSSVAPLDLAQHLRAAPTSPSARAR